jgi:hypothetical protein
VDQYIIKVHPIIHLKNSNANTKVIGSFIKNDHSPTNHYYNTAVTPNIYSLLISNLTISSIVISYLVNNTMVTVIVNMDFINIVIVITVISIVAMSHCIVHMDLVKIMS